MNKIKSLCHQNNIETVKASWTNPKETSEWV